VISLHSVEGLFFFVGFALCQSVACRKRLIKLGARETKSAIPSLTNENAVYLSNEDRLGSAIEGSLFLSRKSFFRFSRLRISLKGEDLRSDERREGLRQTETADWWMDGWMDA